MENMIDKILLKACIDSPDDMIILAIDRQFNYLAFNSFHKNIMKKAYGIDINIGMNLLQCITNEDDIAKARINYGKAFSGSRHITVEEYGKLNREYYETRYNPIYGENGEIIGAAAFSMDVSDKVHTLESLKKSEEKFRKAFVTSPDSININRLSDGVYVSLNEGFTKITGYTEEETIGKSSIELEIWAVPSDRNKLIEGLKNNGKVDNLETVFRMKDGRLITGIMSASVIDIDGTQHILSITRDISDRKRAEIALIESETRYRELVELAVDGILLGSNDGFITDANSYIMSLTGRSRDQLIGIHISDLFVPEDLVKSPLRFDLLHKGETVINERRIFRLDGREIPIEMHTKMMPDGTYQSIYHDITERKKTQTALTESNEKLESIFRAAPVGIGLVVNRVFTDINDTFCEMTGYSRNDLIGKDSEMIYPSKEEYDFVGKEKYKQISLAGSGSVETRFRRKDGIMINVLMSSTPLDIHDFSKGVTFTAMDITELLSKETQLRKLSKAVEQNPVSIIIANTEGLIEYVNPKFCEVTGYSADELAGKNPSILSSHEKTSEEYRILWDTIKSGKEWHGEFHNKKKNGDLYWESALISPIKNEKDEITHFLGIKEDITLRKLLEESTRESEKRYRELFLNNPIPTYIFDESTLEFVEVNDAAIESYGYSRKEFASMTLMDLRIKEEIPELMLSLANIGKSTFHSTSMRHLKKNGTLFPVEITSHSLPEKNGRKTRLVTVIDITDRIKAAEQMIIARDKAEASDRLKTTFLNNISHEVRTPLNGILGFAEIINQPGLSDEERKESLLMLFQSSDRLLNTINSYMDISLLTSGAMSVIKKDFYPAILLSNLFEINQPLCSQKKLQLYLNIPEGGDKVSMHTDPEILRKIFGHLLDNAIKFTDKGTIHFGFTFSESEICFFVRDTGIGIQKKSLHHIFDKFTKEERGHQRFSEGSGLGLSIVKGMTEILGGNISVESEQESGSKFDLTFQIKPASGVITGKVRVMNTDKKFENDTILIAEDDDTNFFYLNAILSREYGSRILHAENGRKAIDLFRENPDIRLVLMDIKMPEIDGFEATRQIKMIRSDVPVIAITAYAMSGDEERILAAGCDSYLSKPISKDRLLRKIAEFVKV